jgi:hypothetical protein
VWSHAELTSASALLLVLPQSGTEKFIFDSESVCIVYSMGEMTIVAYGRNEVLGVCRTEHVHPTLLSVVAHQVRRFSACNPALPWPMLPLRRLTLWS